MFSVLYRAPLSNAIVEFNSVNVNIMLSMVARSDTRIATRFSAKCAMRICKIGITQTASRERLGFWFVTFKTLFLSRLYSQRASTALNSKSGFDFSTTLARVPLWTFEHRKTNEFYNRLIVVMRQNQWSLNPEGIAVMISLGYPVTSIYPKRSESFRQFSRTEVESRFRSRNA